MTGGAVSPEDLLTGGAVSLEDFSLEGNRCPAGGVPHRRALQLSTVRNCDSSVLLPPIAANSSTVVTSVLPCLLDPPPLTLDNMAGPKVLRS